MSSKPSGFINGTVIPVDGGFSAYSGVLNSNVGSCTARKSIKKNRLSYTVARKVTVKRGDFFGIVLRY